MLALKKEKDNVLHLKPARIAGVVGRMEPDISSLIDFAVLAKMENDLPEGMLPDMVGVFVFESIKRVDIIKELFGAGDIVELAKQAHALKGSSATFGASLLSTAALELEMCCNNGRPQEMNELVENILVVSQQSIDSFRNYFKVL